jgi:hypothetical protein
MWENIDSYVKAGGTMYFRRSDKMSKRVALRVRYVYALIHRCENWESNKVDAERKTYVTGTNAKSF